jgi:hypothetical protein
MASATTRGAVTAITRASQAHARPVGGGLGRRAVASMILDRSAPTAPIEACSGDQRLSRLGNRRVDRVLHIMAIVQLRHDTPAAPAAGAGSPTARPPWKRCGRSNATCPTWFTSKASQRTTRSSRTQVRSRLAHWLTRGRRHTHRRIRTRARGPRSFRRQQTKAELCCVEGDEVAVALARAVGRHEPCDVRSCQRTPGNTNPWNIDNRGTSSRVRCAYVVQAGQEPVRSSSCAAARSTAT